MGRRQRMFVIILLVLLHIPLPTRHYDAPYSPSIYSEERSQLSHKKVIP